MAREACSILGEKGPEALHGCPNASLGKSHWDQGFSTQFLLTAGWRNREDLPPPPTSFGGRLDDRPTSLLHLFTHGPISPTHAPPRAPHHLALASLCLQGPYVYTLYIACCACTHHLSLGSGAVKWGELYLSF